MSIMLKLPQVTFIALTGKEFYKHEEVIDLCTTDIEWGAVKVIYDKDCDSIEKWNQKIIYDLPQYVFTSHAFLFHPDGYPINPRAWRDEWLELDYIGAPWPLPQDNYSYRTPSGKPVRVGNSVSLRSKKLMDLVATRPMEFHYGNNNEDGQICVWERDWLEEQGCKFATLEQAVYFSKENELPENKGIKTFAFHQVDL